MALRSLTAEELEEARDARQKAIVEKWLKAGRISRVELEQIRSVIGEEEYRRTLASLGDSTVPDPLGARADYGQDLKDFHPIYHRSPRQLKRWIAAGRGANPPELPPLNEPGRMLTWWNRMMAQGRLKQKAPAVLEQLAIDDAKGTPSSPGARIDVTQFDLQQGEATKQARQFFAAISKQLREAYEVGNDARIRELTPRWKDAMNSLRLAEASDRKAQKDSGDLLPKPEVVSELTTLVETLRNMQSSMSRRIRSRFDVLPPEIDAKLDAAIEAEREREHAAIRRSRFFHSQDEVILELNQAAGVAA